MLILYYPKPDQYIFIQTLEDYEIIIQIYIISEKTEHKMRTKGYAFRLNCSMKDYLSNDQDCIGI